MLQINVQDMNVGPLRQYYNCVTSTEHLECVDLYEDDKESNNTFTS